MPHAKYRVTLTEAEKNLLHDIIDREKRGARKRKRAQVLLLADEEYTDEKIAEWSGMHRRGIEALRKRFVEDGFETTVEGKPRGHRPCSIRGEDEARLLALLRGPPPEGSARWTLRLLEDAWATVENRDVKTVSRESIRRTLKKMNVNPDKAGIRSAD